jgi:hypothetical protein
MLMVAALLACGGAAKPDTQFSLHGGPITASTNAADLRRIYGSGNVRDERIELGEGESVPGTVLFPDDSLRRLTIVWSDTTARSKPSRLILRGNLSNWTLSSGVTLGNTLDHLEKLNQRPFTLAGFGWDYSGVVTDWRGGALAKPLSNVKVYLAPDAGKQSAPEYAKVLGDKDYSSDIAAMRALNPKVYQIFYDFP